MPFDTKVYMAEWRERNREDIRAKHKIWRDANKDKVAATKARNTLSPEKRREYNKRYYLRYKDYAAEWRKANPERMAKYERDCRLRNYARYMWRALKDRAARKGIPFTLTYEQAKHMLDTTKVCPVFGVELAPAIGRRADNSPSFDRFEPALGYVPENVRVISARANVLKGDGTLEELEAIVAWMKSQRQ